MSMVAHPQQASGAERFRTLYQLLAALSRAGTLEDIYDVTLTTLLDVTAADRAAILLLDNDGVMRFKASRGFPRNIKRRLPDTRPGRTVPGTHSH